MSDATYRPLKNYCARRGGIRLSMHGPLRDRLVEEIVACWPAGCPVDRLEEVLTARMRIRLREKHGSVIAMFLLSALASALIRLAIDWWLERRSHRDLMEGWASASQNPDVPS